MFKKIYCIIATLVIAALLIILSVTTVKLNNYGRLSDEFTERLVLAESANRELGNTIEQCREIAGQLRETNSRSIATVRDAIEIIEQLRIEVQELEACLGRFDWDNYYNYWDSVFGIEN